MIEYAIENVGVIGRGEKGLLRIGVFPSFASGFLADLLEKYGAEHPDVQIDFIEGSSKDHILATLQCRIDVAFVPGTTEIAGCNSVNLWDEQVFVALPLQHELAERDSLEWADLQGFPWVVTAAGSGPEIHAYLVQHLSVREDRPRIRRYRVGWTTLFQLITMGQGLTIVGKGRTNNAVSGITYRPLTTGVVLFRAISSDRNDNPACRRLLSLAKLMSKII